jgi:hypothetical protein
MPRPNRLRAALCCALLVGACERATPVPGDAFRDRTPTAKAQARSALQQRSLELEYERLEIEQRLEQPLSLPDLTAAKMCPDARIQAQSKSPAARIVVVRVEDARHKPKSLLPLRIADPLRSREFAVLFPFLRTTPDGARTTSLLRTESSFAEARAALAPLGERRYKTTFFVIDYSEPRLIWKLKKNRREWVDGLLKARLVVHDIDTGTALCETTLTVTNDSSEAPRTLRMLEATRQQLVIQLARKLKQAAVAALAKLSLVLNFDESWAPTRAEGAGHPLASRRQWGTASSKID